MEEEEEEEEEEEVPGAGGLSRQLEEEEEGREEGTGSKKISREAAGAEASMLEGGRPRTSTSLLIWSYWSTPPNKGSPVCISTRTHPKDHMSIATE